MIHRHLLPVLAVFALAFTHAARVSAADNAEQMAQSAAEQWLALIDAGRFGESWQGAAPDFRNKVSEAQWKTTLDTVRKPLGTVQSRKLKRARHTRNLPGAPEGRYVILQFQTAFANQPEAVETVTPVLDQDGKWKVSGYFIK